MQVLVFTPEPQDLLQLPQKLQPPLTENINYIIKPTFNMFNGNIITKMSECQTKAGNQEFQSLNVIET